MKPNESLTISHDSDTWRVIGTGVERDGVVYCHLASTTRYRIQRNGRCPIQMADWIPLDVIEGARQRQAQRSEPDAP